MIRSKITRKKTKQATFQVKLLRALYSRQNVCVYIVSFSIFKSMFWINVGGESVVLRLMEVHFKFKKVCHPLRTRGY